MHRYTILSFVLCTISLKTLVANEPIGYIAESNLKKAELSLFSNIYANRKIILTDNQRLTLIIFGRKAAITISAPFAVKIDLKGRLIPLNRKTKKRMEVLKETMIPFSYSDEGASKGNQDPYPETMKLELGMSEKVDVVRFRYLIKIYIMTKYKYFKKAAELTKKLRLLRETD